MSVVRFACICDHCGKRSEEYSGWFSCTECLEDVCDTCIVPRSGDPETGRAICQRCAFEATLPMCPNCGEPAQFTEHSGDFVETHGLDCGPYERWHEEWLTCNKCGAKTDWK